MKGLRISLTPSLSRFSWTVIEFFLLAALFFLPFSKSVAETGVLVALGLWLLRKFPWNEPWPRLYLCGVVYAFFLGLVILSLTQIPSNATTLGIRGVLKWVKFIGLFFMSYEFCADPKRLKRLIFCFIASMTVVTVDALYQAVQGTDFIKNNPVDVPGRVPRISGPFGSPNSLAIFYLFAVPLATQSWLTQKRWSARAVVSAFLLTAFTLGLCLTFSRGPMLAILTATALYLLIRRKFRWLLFLSLVIGTAFLATPPLKKNFLLSLNPSDITVNTRFEVWKIAWDMALQSPWLGNGVNTFFSRIVEYSGRGSAMPGYAHNCYLQMAVETGFISLVVFLVPFAWYLFVKKLPASPEAQALWIGVVAYLAHSFVDTNFYSLQPAILFWIFWGALVRTASK